MSARSQERWQTAKGIVLCIALAAGVLLFLWVLHQFFNTTPDDSEPPSEPGFPVPSSDGGESSRFHAIVPDGYRLLGEGHGDNSYLWGSDTDGYSTSGFVVLARSEDAEDPDDLTVVELTGFEGYEGGLHQALRIGGGTANELEVGGRPAVVASAGDSTQLVAVRGNDLAVSVRSSQLDDDQLVELLLNTEVPPRAGAPWRHPRVAPPDGWVVLGRASSDLTIGLGAFGVTGGPAAAWSRSWRSPDGERIVTVMTLPASAGDLGATVGFPLTGAGGLARHFERFDLDGREAFWDPGESGRSTLATTTTWGDLLIVKSAPGGPGHPPDPDRDLLESIARSVTPE